MDNSGDKLALYVHWPYCARICPYCDFNVVRDRNRVAEQAGLAAAILADLEAQAGLTGPRRLASISPHLLKDIGLADVPQGRR